MLATAKSRSLVGQGGLMVTNLTSVILWNDFTVPMSAAWRSLI